MKKFSIVFPTRERIELLEKLLQSIKDTVSNELDIEVLIAVDEDDKITRDYIKTQPPFYFVRWFIVQRSLNFSKDYYNFLTKHSTGKWVIAVNDDARFETKDWDVKAEEVLKDKPGVVYGFSEDGLGQFRAKGFGKYCCFPLQGRAGIEAMGYFFPDTIPTWGADIWVRSLYDQVDCVVELPISIMHYCHHNKTREQDHISKRIEKNQVGFDVKPRYEEVNALLGALRKEMNLCKA